MHKRKPVLIAGVLLTLTSLSWSQTLCIISVKQNGIEVQPLFLRGIIQFSLEAKEFALDVSPAACAPTISTIPNNDIGKQIAEKPLIYSQRWAYVVAAGPGEGDKLLWWGRTQFDPELLKSPDSNSFQGKQYLRLCDELKFCPKPFPIFSSGHPFTASQTGASSQAFFRRLSDTEGFDAAIGKSVLSVIYTLWRSLPAEYPMANPEPLLFQPHFVRFTFLPLNPVLK